PQPQKSESKKEETPNIAEVKETIESVQEVEENSDEESQPIQQTKGRRFEDMHSDTVNMVIDLFDGKVID
ncbi:hypothetical protein IKU74_06525, partial [bacterium]|nr:hypothetical protein [bacterium]